MSISDSNIVPLRNAERFTPGSVSTSRGRLYAVMAAAATESIETFRARESTAAGLTALLEEQLHDKCEPELLYQLLGQVIKLCPREIDLECLFIALCRLVEAGTEIHRSAAYRWLAELHRLDLRYENRAKLIMRGGLEREIGLARRRLEAMLRRC